MVWSIVAGVAVGLALVSWRAGPAALRWRPDAAVLRAHDDDPGPRRQRALGSVAVGCSSLLLVPGLGWWGVALAIVLGVGSHLLLGRLLTGNAEHSRELLLAEVPQACDLLAVCLESGLPLRRAAEVVADALAGPLGEALAEVTAKVRLGVDETRAWDELGLREPGLASLGREVARTVASGVALSRTLRSLGMDARHAAASAAEVRARRVGVRSVLPLMTCFLPAFLLLGVVPIIGGVAAHLLR